jgi:DNA gyrase subunit B
MLDGKPRRGTEITFLPSNKIFTTTEFDFATIEHHLRELASLDSGVTMVLTGNRGIERKEVVFHV